MKDNTINEKKKAIPSFNVNLCLLLVIVNANLVLNQCYI